MSLDAEARNEAMTTKTIEELRTLTREELGELYRSAEDLDMVPDGDKVELR